MQYIFHEEKKNNDGLAGEIEQASQGLIYISETDAPLLPFAGTQIAAANAETILHQTGHAADTPVEEVDFRAFFARLTAINDWYEDARKASAERFLDLQKLLEENLRELKVFKIGRIQLDIFVVGIDKDGCLMGVTTKAVET